MGWICKAERVEEIWKVKSSWEGVGRRRKSRNCLKELAKAIVTLSWLLAMSGHIATLNPGKWLYVAKVIVGKGVSVEMMMWKKTTSRHRQEYSYSLFAMSDTGLWRRNANKSCQSDLIQFCQHSFSSKAILHLHSQIIIDLDPPRKMSSLLEESYSAPPVSITGSQSPPPPIQSYQLRQSVCEVETELLIQTFDDRILVIVTQNGKVGCLVSLSTGIQ